MTMLDTPLLAERAREPRRSVLILTLLRQDKAAMLGMIVLGVIGAAALLGPMLYPLDPVTPNLAQTLRPPLSCDDAGTCYLAGTDQLGRDVMSRLMHGARLSLIVGFGAVAVGSILGSALGLVTGYFGGVLDMVTMRLADAQLAIPTIMLAIAVLAVLGPSLANLIAVLGISGWVVYARILRVNVMSVRAREFVTAARVLGASPLRVMFRHVLPNSIDATIVIATSQLATLMVAEAALSFLGLGVPPPTPTWGNMLADGRSYLTAAWWIATLPGLALTVTVLAVNLVGDWIRDVTDPKILRA